MVARVGVLGAMIGAVSLLLYMNTRKKVLAIHVTEAGCSLRLAIPRHASLIAFYCLDPHMAAWYWHVLDEYKAPHVHMVKLGDFTW